MKERAAPNFDDIPDSFRNAVTGKSLSAQPASAPAAGTRPAVSPTPSAALSAPAGQPRTERASSARTTSEYDDEIIPESEDEREPEALLPNSDENDTPGRPDSAAPHPAQFNTPTHVRIAQPAAATATTATPTSAGYATPRAALTTPAAPSSAPRPAPSSLATPTAAGPARIAIPAGAKAADLRAAPFGAMFFHPEALDASEDLHEEAVIQAARQHYLPELPASTLVNSNSTFAGTRHHTSRAMHCSHAALLPYRARLAKAGRAELTNLSADRLDYAALSSEGLAEMVRELRKDLLLAGHKAVP